MPGLSYQLLPICEGFILVKFGENISPLVHKMSHRLCRYLEKNAFPGFLKHIITATGAAINYNPLVVRNHLARSTQSTFDAVAEVLERDIIEANKLPYAKARVVEIPVCYGYDFGPDLDYVADHNNMSHDAVITLHTHNDYICYASEKHLDKPLLSKMDRRIASPKRKKNHLYIPDRSIAIRDDQTSCFSSSIDGSWRIIGRSAIDMEYDEAGKPLMQPGDIVRLRSITIEEYRDLRYGMTE